MRFQLLCCYWLVLAASTSFARDITTLSDQIYRDVTVKRIDPLGIVLVHRSGVAFVDYSNLPPAIRAEFGYNETVYAAAQIAKQQQTTRPSVSSTAVELPRSIHPVEEFDYRPNLKVEVDRNIRDSATKQIRPDQSEESISERKFSSQEYTKRDYSTPRYTESTPSTGGPVHVKGYFRKDGTYVRPHTRRR